MTTNNSEVEALAQHKASMGEALGELYFHLWKELALLHFSWSEYRVIFGTSAKPIELLNSVAPRFAYQLDYLMWHDVLLGLTRLTDPGKSAGKENLTICSLPRLIAEDGLRATVKGLVSEARTATEFARDWRNRHLAHRDLLNATSPEAHPLATASRASVEAALKCLRNVLNHVLGHYEDTTFFYEHSGVSAGGVHSLLRALQRPAGSPS